MTIYRDDPILCEHPDAVPNWQRARIMGIWFSLLRDVSDRIVNLPEWRIIACPLLWPEMEEEMI